MKEETKMRTTAQVLVDCLEAEGVDVIFGIPGEETLDLMFAIRDSKIRFIPVRHEQGAAFMADVYGRLTGRAGVCLSTLGPGATNLVTGVADAYLDGAPLVAITGQVGTDRMQLTSHQYLDLTAMFDENGLREALARKINKADNVEVHITDDNVLVTADTNLLGHKAQLSLVGHIVADDGTLYFDTDQFDIQNSPFGTARLGDSLGRIALVKPEQLPLKMRVVSVDQQEGSVIVRAGEE